MKKFPKILLTFLVVFIMYFCFPLMSHAQTVGDPGCDPLDPKCPIDGGVSVLLAMGVGYGIKKMKSFHKKETIQ